MESQGPPGASGEAEETGWAKEDQHLRPGPITTGNTLTSTPIGLCGYWLWTPQFPLNTGISLPGKYGDSDDNSLTRCQTFTLLGTPPGRCHYYTHFSDEGTEGQSVKGLEGSKAEPYFPHRTF